MSNGNYSKRKKRSKKPVVIFVAVAAAAAVIAGIVCAYKYYEAKNQEYIAAVAQAIDIDVFYDGISVEGIELGGLTKEQALKKLKQVQSKTRPKIKITVNAADEAIVLKKSDFKFSYDTQEIIDKAYVYARTGDRDKRYETVNQLKKSGKEFNITATLKKSSVKDAVKKVADKVNIEVTQPDIADFVPEEDRFVISEGKDGREVDEDDLKQKLEELLEEDYTGTIDAVVNTVECMEVPESLKKDVGLLGRYTTVSTNTADGTYNMELALSKMNGTKILPGETFSFNETTGDSTNDSQGFRKAGAISGGKLIDEYGGGICQASTTLYGAVLRADLKVIERYNHSWPSTYVPIGQDAAINYPSQDFRFQNDTGSSIFINSYMDGKTLVVEIYGKQDKSFDEIKIESEKTETIPAGDPVEQKDSTLKSGTRETYREERTGYRAKAYKVFYKSGKEIKREEIASSYYPPITAIIKVGTKK